MRMFKEKQFNLSGWYIAGLLVIMLVALGVFSFLGSQKKTGTAQQVGVQISSAPTLIPTSVEIPGWKTYIYPSNAYSFSYPPEWKITATEGENPRVSISFHEENKEYMIRFMSGGVGGPPYDSIDKKNVFYGGKKGEENIYIKNGKPSVIAIYFDDFSSKKYPFSWIEIDLPSTNTEKYLSLSQKILSTLKFTQSAHAPNVKN